MSEDTELVLISKKKNKKEFITAWYPPGGTRQFYFYLFRRGNVITACTFTSFQRTCEKWPQVWNIVYQRINLIDNLDSIIGSILKVAGKSAGNILWLSYDAEIVKLVINDLGKRYLKKSVGKGSRAVVAFISQASPVLLTDPLACPSLSPHVCDLGLASYSCSFEAIRSWRLLPSITERWPPPLPALRAGYWPLTSALDHSLSMVSILEHWMNF